MMIPPFDLVAFSELCQQRIHQQWLGWLAAYTSPSARLMEAIRYTTLNGGKRFRPILVYATAQALKGALEPADHAAMAIELIHIYSLIHDDLPAMDDDDLRRGQPTCHIAFDEATAILVGDALHSLAFEIIAADDSLSATTRLSMIKLLARAAGAQGMVAGQALDMTASMQNRTTHSSLQQLETIHHHKTGALIQASVALGALAASSYSAQQYSSLQQYAHHLGLAFQIQDDILDVIGDTQVLGKQSGADSQQHKLTYPALLGLEQAQKRAKTHYEHALAALESWDANADGLRALAHYVIKRQH